MFGIYVSLHNPCEISGAAEKSVRLQNFKKRRRIRRHEISGTAKKSVKLQDLIESKQRRKKPKQYHKCTNRERTKMEDTTSRTINAQVQKKNSNASPS